ncbi:MAG: hypothetical protein ACRDJ3_00940, partial [Solirubrobacteraceae bacterium]
RLTSKTYRTPNCREHSETAQLSPPLYRQRPYARIRDLTENALEAGSEIAHRLAYEASARPFFARELADIASTGARGLKTELAYFIEEGR